EASMICVCRRGTLWAYPGYFANLSWERKMLESGVPKSRERTQSPSPKASAIKRRNGFGDQACLSHPAELRRMPYTLSDIAILVLTISGSNGLSLLNWEDSGIRNAQMREANCNRRCRPLLPPLGMLHGHSLCRRD